MNRKRLITVRSVLIFLTVAVMSMIFILSADNADESNAKSDVIADSLIYNILSYFELSDEQMEDFIHVIVLIVRKTAHFAEYAVLGFLLSAVCVSFYLKPKITVPVSVAVGALYAVSDEIHQYFVPGRSCQFSDMCIDSAGVICGVIALLLIVFIYKRIIERKRLRAE